MEILNYVKEKNQLFKMCYETSKYKFCETEILQCQRVI